MLQSVHPPATDAPHGTHTSALKKTIAGLFDSSFRGSPGPCLRPLLKSYFEALLSHARIDLPDEDPILFKAVFLLPLPSISDAIAAVTRRDVCVKRIPIRTIHPVRDSVDTVWPKVLTTDLKGDRATPPWSSYGDPTRPGS